MRLGYRERIPAGPVALESVPVLEKAEMMARFDDLVTDPRLRRDELLEWIATRRRDELFEDRYRVMTTSGSSGRPVPPGEPGARVLVTNLHNLVQPIVRLAVADVLTLDPDPCPCGRSLVRAAAIGGRHDDVLSLILVSRRACAVP